MKHVMLDALAIGLAAAGLIVYPSKADDSNGATERAISQDVNDAPGRSPTTLPIGEHLAQQPSTPEPMSSALPPPSVSRSGSASIDEAPNPGNPKAGHEFALGTCTPCHVVSPDQKSPIRFADAPDLRTIANFPGLTAMELNIWLTNPHPAMPKLVLYPQEAADVIAYILSLRGQR